ncbi:putative FYVE zinc finger, fungal lipase-like domain, Zinc finger, FYVE/PHD-type [Plasmopara halstedii]
MLEIIENQRWYPILGWSARLHADDPPAWCTTNQESCLSKDEQKDYVWTVYKGVDYDKDGWLYGELFNDTLGQMTRSSVVRARVWMGNKRTELTEVNDQSHDDISLRIANNLGMVDSNHMPILDTKKNEETANLSAEQSCETLGDLTTMVGKDNVEMGMAGYSDKGLTTPAGAKEDNTNSEEPSYLGFFGRFSSAVISLPSSAISLAGSSSMQAVYGTVQSIKEASVYGLEMAQAATAAAIYVEPQALPMIKYDSYEEIQSMLSKRFPDLSPVERSLVTCCKDSVPKYVSPPEVTESKNCKECNIEFGMTKFRYLCGYCCESFCRDHLPESAIIRAYGHMTSSKLCKNCHYIITEKIDRQLVQWRIERVNDFFVDKLIPYYNTVTDTAVDKIMRAAGGTLVAAKSAPIGAATKMAVVSVDFLRKYGRAGLIGFILRNEFIQSFSTLKGLLGDLGDLGFQDAAIGTYYFMAMNRGDRGAEPEREKNSHYGCESVSDEVLAKMLKYAPLALHGIYEEDVLDIQRISRLQGFLLIYAHVQNQGVRHPSFALLGNKETKTALVLIRGSKSVQDALTDIQACPEEIGLSSAGAESEATGGFVDAFAHNGMLKAVMWIKDRIIKSLRVLHSEGYQLVFAGHSLGAGCATLLSVMLQKEFNDLECFAYAVPACVDFSMAESCENFVHSIILRDDIVPRAKASNVMKLVEELKNFKGCWRDTAFEDFEAFKDRAKTLWAPRKREWAKEAADQRRGKLARGTDSKDTLLLAEKKAKESEKNEGISTWTLTRTNLIDQLDKIGDKQSEDEPSDEILKEEHQIAAVLITNLYDDPKELFVPGKVTHIYFYKGIYEAVHVDRKCEELSHIPVQQNMLSDHLGRNYLSALRIVRDARRAKPTLPDWTPFSTKTRCMCCDSPFTWNSTSSSEAQQNRDQHNCRRCGALVCEGCSQKFRSIPEFGINVPVRVCDRCYYEV